jgi:hypothetical protein
MTKADRKYAGELMNKGLARERNHLFMKVKELISKYEAGEADDRDTYMNLYSAVQKADKEIARRYDGINPKMYFDIVMWQYWDKLITYEELQGFSEEGRAEVQKIIDRAKNR